MSDKHTEAFCIKMQYASEDRCAREWLWNSRDGVTPFCITAKDGKTELWHIDWAQDIPSPQHVPQPGDRVFVDATPELAKPAALALIDSKWDHPEYPMRTSFSSKEAALAILLDTWCKPGSPWMITVGPEGWKT